MKESGRTTRIAVIGFGPRGLGALEALAELLPRYDHSVSVDVFDPYPKPGAGPNFDPRESRLCLLNIPNRDIAISPPSFSRCGRFAEWMGSEPDPDAFPTRPDLGRYLEARLSDLLEIGMPNTNIIPEKVTRIEHSAEGWRLEVAGQLSMPYDEILLTLGQPKVAPDDQLAAWQDHAARSAGQVAQAYPANRLIQEAADWSGKVVAIRGLGLSAFDVLRALTTAQGGHFHDGGYRPCGREPARILPFSLDGKPPFPKPETETLDAVFEPLGSETGDFSVAIAQASKMGPDAARRLINAALAPVVTRILLQNELVEDAKHVAQWLETEWDSPGSQETDGPYETLRFGIKLAEGTTAPTIGYTVGQIWRKWQDNIRAGFNPAETPAATAKSLVDFDEGLKRYSYGPPVSSAREMVALIKAGLVDLDLAADPEIDLTDQGWVLRKKGDLADVSVMIDAVLPSPDLSAITATLVSELNAQGQVVPLAEGLAAHTAPDGSVIDAKGGGLCLLGRLALGSVIAVDSLHDCFGEASARWARGVVDRKNAPEAGGTAAIRRTS
ncbi:FAD/NAD(P)-binding protein [Puniceibacterium sediminis]|uniref:Uncharacterized NAD(P)/FAD-binding protein YdhS n=1 Tax=Puniceibacterium sediminis TaxID=1608407 RepID=A0A238V3C9_9RHOB|nr:FAD/NAD(P)-binding protein [Puniceibacterium sediminis]SNR28574.1 Uncharacterized NAD(P)/FAD-binding protein YdhS [Puniceibacterium sediminis]